ncbi:MAG: type I methionyl aminopeptidase [Parcubacteria group bacterium]|nr:type I methionyl aminopeptidase [Parcubacteria group bacterium]
MIRLKTKEDIIKLQEGGTILARIMRKLHQAAKPGVSAAFLDELAFQLIRDAGGRPSFLNYKPEFALRAFPNSLCISLNETIVHGVPRKNLILKRGDLVSLDIGMEFKGLFTDHAITFGVGPITVSEKKLIRATQQALMAAIKVARPNRTLGDIGYAIEKEARKYGFQVIKDLTGHGVGYTVHEDPPVFNYGEPNTGLELKAGLVLAIEPMMTFATSSVKENSDGSFSTLDGKKACHFEHTIAILKNKTIILTK